MTTTHTDIADHGWVSRLPPGVRPYILLLRLDRPIGAWLLFLPGLWGLLLPGAPAGRTVWLIILFAIGSVAMRGAGCVVNDMWDRDLDRLVARTAGRPLASGALRMRQAAWVLAVLLLAGLLVLLQLNPLCWALGAGSLILVGLYPLAKRVTWWPQLVMGFTFGFGAPMGVTAVTGRITPAWFALYAAAILWDLGFDTVYAHQDREDDALARCPLHRPALRRTHPPVSGNLLRGRGRGARSGRMAEQPVPLVLSRADGAGGAARPASGRPRYPRSRRLLAAVPAEPRSGAGRGRRIAARPAVSAAFIVAHTQLARPPLVPEITLHLATEITPIWQASEVFLAQANIDPPFWAFAWPGGQALARYILDNPDLVRGRRVLDFAAGGGLAAIACAMAGAAQVEAAEIDPMAASATALNAEANGVDVSAVTADLVGTPCRWDLILCGDVCYEAPMTGHILPWLRSLSAAATVWIADPGRAYLPAGMTPLATYDIPTSRELEDLEIRRTVLYRL